MLKIFEQSLKRCNNIIITGIPLIAFCTIIILYYQFMILTNDTALKHITSIFTLFIMSGGLLASWLYSVKKSLEDSKSGENTRNLTLITSRICKYLFKGVGRLFFPCIGYLALNIILFSLIFSVTAYISTSIPLIIASPNTILVILFIILTLLTVLWLPELVYNERNALFALYNSIIKVYTDFTDTMRLYLFIIALISAIYVIVVKFIFSNIILSFVVLMIAYYSVLYIVVLLFTYYEQKFIEEQKE